MRLPDEFMKKMEGLLGKEEYGTFIKSLDMPRCCGLRVNMLKISVDEFLRISPFKLEPIPWSKDGFYFEEGENPGKHPYYHAGLYYIQEPSAMLPGEVLNARPGEYVLDLCAAPGGKTVQIAAGMEGKGLLLANDVNYSRVKALVKNIELCGVRNAIVTNESPEALAERFKEYFDKILVDAPCSGEGMFRKNPDAVKSWERYKCEKCSAIQGDILQKAGHMLKPGGRMVYSTCTFSPEEDEIIISDFLDKYSDFEIEDIPELNGIEGGRPHWCGGKDTLAGTARLWPHRIKGEGHFVALLRKKGQEGQKAQEGPKGHEDQITLKTPKAQKDQKTGTAAIYPDKDDSGYNGFIGEPALPKAFNEFMEQNFNIDLQTELKGYYILKGRNLYRLPEKLPDLNSLKVAKFGWYLGEFNREKFQPSHSMVIALKKHEIVNTIDFGTASRETAGYLKGETLMIEGKKGLTAICAGGYTLGWAMQTGDMLKNLYPKGWRMQ